MTNRIFFPIAALIVATTVLLSTFGPAMAAQGFIEAKVLRVLMSADDRWGGCMAALSPGPQTVLASCADHWVTFSCSGHFTDRVRAYRMMDEAQLAFATGDLVAIWFQDDKTHNGYCFANRIDVRK